MAALTFQMTDAQFQAKRAEAQANGLNIQGYSGAVSEDGCTFSYIFDEPTLTVTIIKKPWYIAESVVESKLKELLSV